jgi:hypothetical protein
VSENAADEEKTNNTKKNAIALWSHDKPIQGHLRRALPALNFIQSADPDADK